MIFACPRAALILAALRFWDEATRALARRSIGVFGSAAYPCKGSKFHAIIAYQQQVAGLRPALLAVRFR